MVRAFGTCDLDVRHMFYVGLAMVVSDSLERERSTAKTRCVREVRLR